ncbi:MAG: DUF3821 domain-containing protein [Methanoregula sp.]|nr:DUF3821 domain-containing protein [Methanoregula sp.]
MNGKIGWITLVIIITSICGVFPATAVLNRVPTGGTVYIGEEGLDISIPLGATNTQVGWWNPGASFLTQPPDYTINVTEPLNFFISPNVFAMRTGNWYAMPAKALAFNVKDPQIGIRIEDTSINGDITDNGWVYRGDEVRFRIDSNLADIAGRPGAGAVEPTVTIKVQGPDGGTYSALMNKAGVLTPLDVSVSTTPFYNPGPVWDTGSSSYTPGTYTIWAECNANRMKDNYNIVGKTVSAQRYLRVQEQNPLIGVTVLTTSPTNQQTTKITIKPTTIVTTKPTTTVLTTMATPVETVQSPISTTPAPTPTKAAGLSGWCAVLAGIIGCALYGARRR